MTFFVDNMRRIKTAWLRLFYVENKEFKMAKTTKGQLLMKLTFDIVGLIPVLELLNKSDRVAVDA